MSEQTKGEQLHAEWLQKKSGCLFQFSLGVVRNLVLTLDVTKLQFPVFLAAIRETHRERVTVFANLRETRHTVIEFREVLLQLLRCDHVGVVRLSLLRLLG